MIRSYCALVALGAVLVAGCASGGGAAGTPAAPVAPVAPAGPVAPVAPEGAVAPVPAPAPLTAEPAGPSFAVTVKLDEYSFEPEELVVPLGAVVKLTVVNIGKTRHDFNILSPYNIEGDLLPSSGGQVLTFKADKPGRFQIVCSQKNHKDQGMVGYLVVQ